MTEPLTRKRALEITRDLWKWLGENPGKMKGGWPGWEELPSIAHDCACCQFVADELGLNSKAPDMPCAFRGGVKFSVALKLCPLKSIWPKGCNHRASPFQLWVKDKNSTQNALQISQAAEAELKKESE